MNRDAMFARMQAEQVEIKPPIDVGVEARRAIVASLDDVERNAGKT